LDLDIGYFRFSKKVWINESTWTGLYLGCAESVVWSVFKEPLKISYHQLKRFWELRTTTAGVEEHLIENFRSKIFRKSLFLNFSYVSKLL
jgi:hypothetical protein